MMVSPRSGERSGCKPPLARRQATQRFANLVAPARDAPTENEPICAAMYIPD
jgi:hypothetical protein